MPLSFYRREDLPKVPQLKGSDMGLENMLPVGLSVTYVLGETEGGDE